MSTAWPAEERVRAIDWAPLEAIRADVVGALVPVLAGAEAARALTQLLKRHPAWNAGERHIASEALFGVALWRRRLLFHSRDAAPEALLDVLVHRLGGRGETSPPPKDWPTRFSFPDWLACELSDALGVEAERFAAASNLPGPIVVRANSLKTDRDALAKQLAAEGVETRLTQYAPDGLLLAGRPNILGLAGHQSGLFEVQDEGSQLVGICLGAKPGDSVLDLCAGSGGKTLFLGAALQDQGRLYAYDVDSTALERLEHRALRAGLGRSLVVFRALPPDLGATHVLVDAPCSALGTLRRGPDVRWRMSPDSLRAFPAFQRDLLDVAATHTLPGGQLVYATCTLRVCENQDVVQSFLAAHPEFSREPAPVPGELRSVKGELMTLPHRNGTDGFYAAVLRRSA
jgi:16S rRNA (cytosine967-C5)-methyltransferase